MCESTTVGVHISRRVDSDRHTAKQKALRGLYINMNILVYMDARAYDC